MSFLSRFLKKGAPEVHSEPVEFTFKQRVEAFWEWYSQVGARFHKTISDKDSSTLVGEVSDKVDELLSHMAWVFGPEAGGEGHSFTLSGEGVAEKQILAAYWLERAPELEGWTFYASRQPTDDPGRFTIKMDDREFKPLEFWVTPEIDEESECVDITVWHPLIERAGEKTAMSVLFLFLDEIFGEFGTGRWIGAMDFSKDKLGASMPIVELRDHVAQLQAERGWQMREPGRTWGSYSLKPENRHIRKPRFDTIAGTSACFGPLREYLHHDGEAEDPFGGLHADWVYISFDSSVLPEDRPVDAREDMADAITAALEKEQSGRYLGGAIGTMRSYMDFLIYDGSRSIKILREAARSAGLPPGTRLEYLAASKRDQDIVLVKY